jgi:hypothetical protein
MGCTSVYYENNLSIDRLFNLKRTGFFTEHTDDSVMMKKTNVLITELSTLLRLQTEIVNE